MYRIQESGATESSHLQVLQVVLRECADCIASGRHTQYLAHVVIVPDQALL